MPSFDISLDGRSIADPHGAEIQGFSAHVICSRVDDASMGVDGMVNVGGKRNVIQWVSRSLASQSVVEFTYLGNEYTDFPDATEAEVQAAKQTAIDKIAKLKEQFKGLVETVQSRPLTYEHCNKALEVSVSGINPVTGVLGSEESLQLVLTWFRGECTLALDSITVLPSGYTKGTTYLKCALTTGQCVKVRYVA